MRLRTFLLVSCAAIGLQACASSSEPPLYGNYENVDDQSLCLGIMAFAADFPQAVWPGKSKGFYADKKEFLGIRSAALYKIALKKYGKEDAAARGMTGYSSGKSLAYVLGGHAVQNALGRCTAVAEEALAVDAEYQNFLDHLGQEPVDPVNADIVPAPVTATNTELTTTFPVVEPELQGLPEVEAAPVEEVKEIDETKVNRIMPQDVPEGMKVLSTPRGDFLIADPEARKKEDSADSLNANWRDENL